MIEGFPPVVDESSRVLILGTMPGEESLKRKEYYGHPRNQFWQILFSLFDRHFECSYEAKISLLKENRIALWDVIKSCDRNGSADAAISNMRLNDIGSLIAAHPGIKAIFFDGQKAYDTFRKNKMLDPCPGLILKVLPSTSPRYATLTLEMKMREWSVIRSFLQSTEQSI